MGVFGYEALPCFKCSMIQACNKDGATLCSDLSYLSADFDLTVGAELEDLTIPNTYEDCVEIVAEVFCSSGICSAVCDESQEQFAECVEKFAKQLGIQYTGDIDTNVNGFEKFKETYCTSCKICIECRLKENNNFCYNFYTEDKDAFDVIALRLSLLKYWPVDFTAEINSFKYIFCENCSIKPKDNTLCDYISDCISDFTSQDSTKTIISEIKSTASKIKDGVRSKVKELIPHKKNITTIYGGSLEWKKHFE